MQDALTRMFRRTGKTVADYGRNSKLGRVFRKRGIPTTPEVKRVLALPRRKWAEDAELSELADAMTAWLKTPEGTMRLRPVQAKALEELHDFGGLVAPIRVGGGKTLISMLAPIVVGSERPLLVVPAKLRNKTRIEFGALRKHWLWHPKLEILSYEVISRDNGYAELERINPDLIIGDEIHRAKNKSAGVTRKLSRWQKEHPETRWALMSGTITTRSVKDYAHLAKWALPKLCPLPEHANEVAEWADALDEKVDPNRRLAPGALLGMCNDEELATIAAEPGRAMEMARHGYRRRLVETPAIVATEERALGVSLEILQVPIDLSVECGKDFRRMREDFETPDGHPFTEAVELWRHCRELVCGMFYRWDPEAPIEWLAARREWTSFARKILADRRKGIDTEFQVAKACKAGELDRSAYDAWTAIRDSFEPNSVPVWRHNKALTLASAWLVAEPGLVWVEHVAFGRELSQLTGIPYFSEGGLDEWGVAIEATSSDRAIVSIASMSEGHNLQRWNRNLVVSPPPNGRIWEQCLGRTHREGQEADEVTYEVVLACREQWEGLQQALADARYIEQTTGQPQKLLYADKDLPTEADVAALAQSGNPLWKEKR